MNIKALRDKQNNNKSNFKDVSCSYFVNCENVKVINIERVEGEFETEAGETRTYAYNIITIKDDTDAVSYLKDKDCNELEVGQSYDIYLEIKVVKSFNKTSVNVVGFDKV